MTFVEIVKKFCEATVTFIRPEVSFPLTYVRQLKIKNSFSSVFLKYFNTA